MAKTPPDNDSENAADVPEVAAVAAPVAEAAQDTEAARPDAYTVTVVPVGPITSTTDATLDNAFTMLCEALKERLDDDLPAQLHCDEIQGWYANGNEGVAWAARGQLLERVVGVKIGT